MTTAAPQKEQCYTCNACGLPLPIRLPLPGEVAGSWECRYCGSRFFATLIDNYSPEILSNVRPAEDIHPRIAIGGKILAEMYRRKGRDGRGFEERHFTRIRSDFALSVVINGEELTAQVIDLSAGGVGFTAGKPADVTDEITVRFESIPGRPTTRCIVRNCVATDDNQYRIGAEFQSPKSPD